MPLNPSRLIDLAYFWDPIIKKVRKKYIGKHLPYPFSFGITIRKE